MFTHVVLLALASSVSCFNEEVDEKFQNLPHDEFVKYFNSQNFSYKITHYDGIDKKAVNCAEGPEIIPIPVPVKYNINSNEYTPSKFDGREWWRHCFGYARDQGECGACWAITIATVASIRTCLRLPFPIPIHDSHNSTEDGGGPVSLRGLSPADLMCCKDCFTDDFCGKGSTEKAALFWLKHGLVSNGCKPHLDKSGTSDCKKDCLNDTLYYDADKQFGDSVTLLLSDDHEIRREIYWNGPVVATFALYEDLRDYKEGIYEHTHGKIIGFHSVPVIGYGDENGVPYWLAANTWGHQWGEHSTFKVKRKEHSLSFESQVLSLIPRADFVV